MVVGGFDGREGHERDFVMYLWKEGGYGARPGKKDNHTAISLYASGTRNEPVEVQERVYPVLTHCYEFITDSAGAGRHRGGLGVARDFELTHGDATLSVLGSRGVIPVWGWEGGLPALGSGLVYDAGGPDEFEVGVMRSGVHAGQGRTIRFWEGGGGGWQDPRTRPAEWVLEDVIDGFVSIEAARELYGVAVSVIDEDAARYEIDEAETGRLRADGAPGADCNRGLRRGMTPRRVSVVIADDHPVYRRGLADALRACPDLELVADTADGQSALAAIRRLVPRIAVVDLQLPGLDGIDAAAARARRPRTVRRSPAHPTDRPTGR